MPEWYETPFAAGALALGGVLLGFVVTALKSRYDARQAKEVQARAFAHDLQKARDERLQSSRQALYLEVIEAIGLVNEVIMGTPRLDASIEAQASVRKFGTAVRRMSMISEVETLRIARELEHQFMLLLMSSLERAVSIRAIELKLPELTKTLDNARKDFNFNGGIDDRPVANPPLSTADNGKAQKVVREALEELRNALQSIEQQRIELDQYIQSSSPASLALQTSLYENMRRELTVEGNLSPLSEFDQRSQHESTRQFEAFKQALKIASAARPSTQ